MPASCYDGSPFTLHELHHHEEHEHIEAHPASFFWENYFNIVLKSRHASR